jgi:hypothetical protein
VTRDSVRFKTLLMGAVCWEREDTRRVIRKPRFMRTSVFIFFDADNKRRPYVLAPFSVRDFANELRAKGWPLDG